MIDQEHELYPSSQCQFHQVISEITTEVVAGTMLLIAQSFGSNLTTEEYLIAFSEVIDALNARRLVNCGGVSWHWN